MLLEILYITSFFKILEIILMSGIKFIFAPPLSFELGFNYIQTILFTTTGGIAGVFFFYYFSKLLIKSFQKYFPLIIQYLNPEQLIKFHKEKKIFTKRNKMIINIMKKYGRFGIITLTPILFSIPFGTFIVSRYFSKKPYTFLYLSLSILVWSFLMTTAYFITVKRF